MLGTRKSAWKPHPTPQASFRIAVGLGGVVHDTDEFKKFILNHMDVIESMWDYLAKPDNVILAVEVPGDPVPIDINDWQYLMPPIVPVGPYTKESVNEIIDQLQEPGTYYMGKLPSHVVQMHFSAIVPSMIRQLVPMFDKNGNQFEQSLILASKLAPRILAYQEEVNF